MGFWSAIRAIGGKKSAKSEVLSPQDFTAEMERRLRLANPGAAVERVGDLELTLRSKGAEDNRLFLDNAYRTYQAEDENGRDESIERYVRAFLSASLGLTYGADAIVPIIKDKYWLRDIRESMANSGVEDIQEQVYEELNSELIVLYAADTPDNISYVSPEELAKLAIDRSKLRSHSVRNLRGLIPGLNVNRGGAISMVTAGGNYEASLLLFADLWERERERLRGEPVIAVPARDLLLFADSADADAIERLQLMASKACEESTYAVSDKLFVFRNGDVLLWEGSGA